MVLVPQIQVAQLVVGVVLEADGGGGRPLGVLLGDALLGDAGELELLVLAQLADEGALAVGVGDDGVADEVAGAVVADDEVAGVDLHDVVRGAARVQGQGDAAPAAGLVAVAVARVVHLVDLARVERDQAQAVRDELVGQHRRVGLDLHQVDGDGRHLGLDHAAQRVREGQVDVAQLEVDVGAIGLLFRGKAIIRKAKIVSRRSCKRRSCARIARSPPTFTNVAATTTILISWSWARIA